ncbi:MAG: SulP family inorganic anion transporter [Alphaproteobacteria bacterium]|nr:SulP family inorganic anion transporter [Alphaproteobacteria bacterium]
MRQPILFKTIKNYNRSAFFSDLIAGLTVAMVALPLSIAIAIASGADPAKGLVTAIVAGGLISLLGGSKVQIGGPTGAFIVVVFGIIAEHGYDGLVLATFMAGIILLVAGYYRAGRLISYVPEAVVTGFTIGIAIVIAASQLPDLLGFSLEHVPAEFIEKLSVLWAEREQLQMQSFGIAALTMGLIVLFKRAVPRFPGLIVAVGIGSVLVYFANLPIETLGSRFGELPNRLPMPQFPEISPQRLIELLPSALVIAFLAGVESLLSAMVADRMIKEHHRPNAELLAQGAANIGSALFAGLPATGAIARTATNIRAGGKTPVAGIVHAAVILVIMLIAAPLAGYLAMPVLAAVLMITAWNMSEPHKWGEYARGKTSDKFLLLLTMVLTVVVDLTVAIGVGVALGFALRLHQRAHTDSDWTPPER